MKRKPSDDLRRLFEEAAKKATKTSAYEVADRIGASIVWMQGYLRHVEEAIQEGDFQTFADPRRERQFAKDEFAKLVRLLDEVREWLSRDPP